MYFLEGASNYELFIAAAVLIGIAVSFRPIVRRVMKADKIKMFSWENHVNKKHKKIDWGIRISAVIGIIILWGIQTSIISEGGGLRWYLGPYMVLFAMVPLVELLRAYMEWKHAENRNNFKVTLLDLGFLTVLTVTFFATGFFGALDFRLLN